MPPDAIESPKNPRIKALVRLRSRRERTRTGVTLVEGARETGRALGAGVEVREAFVCTALLRGEGTTLPGRLHAAGVPVTEVSLAAFARLSQRQGPDGVACLIRPPVASPDLLLPFDALVVVAAGLEKPGNLGALLRSADAAGADAMVVSGGGTDPWNPGVVRASMGSVFACPVLDLPPEAARAWLRRRGLRVLATVPTAATPYWDADLRGAVAIVLGPEHEGLDPAWAGAADARVGVPMTGAADSLNVSVTGALMLFEARRQRRDRARDA